MTDEITIRDGRPGDAEHFAELNFLTAPEYFEAIFGKDSKAIFRELFVLPGNIFSFQYSHFMEVNGEIAGMSLFYSYDEKNKGMVPFVAGLIKYLKLRFFAHIPALLKTGAAFAQIKKGDLYSSSSAIYSKFRGRGLGEKLFSLAEEAARKRGLKRVVINIKADNVAALGLRKKLGYILDKKLPMIKVGGKEFKYLQMSKRVC
jgi:ribosomal protein S18 acetylase RimI-like enzyme